MFVFSQNSVDYNKNEFFVGGITQRFDTSDSRIPIDTDTGYGFQASYVRNIHKFIGVKGDVSGAYSKLNNRIDVFNNPNFSIETRDNRSIYNVLGGVQFKDNASTSRVKPFAHALFGLGHVRLKESTVCLSGPCTPTTLRNETSQNVNAFSIAVGAGIDFRMNDKIDLRVNADYNPIIKNGKTLNSARLSFGIVFK